MTAILFSSRCVYDQYFGRFFNHTRTAQILWMGFCQKLFKWTLVFLCKSWWCWQLLPRHNDSGMQDDVMMSAMAFQITGVQIVYSTVCSVADQRKHQSFASLAFVRGIHRWPVNSPHKGPVTRRKMFPFDDVIMSSITQSQSTYTETEILYILVMYLCWW